LLIDDHQPRPERARRRQGEATRARLLAAAVPALAGNGYHAARVDDVVRIAGVLHGTFYTYFANMEGLFRALGEECADEGRHAGRVARPGRSGARRGGRAAGVAGRVRGLLPAAQRGDPGVGRDQVSDCSLARLGTASFARIATTLQASMVDPD
jgi:AcrR family transcriptional regulator